MPTNDEALLRLPGVLGVIPVCKSDWYLGMKSGRYPLPIKVGRMSFWRASDIQKLIEQLAAKETV